MELLKIIGLLFITILLVFPAGFATFMAYYFIHFKWRVCRLCGHNMKYKGLKLDKDKTYYVFHCPKCDTWEQILKEDFLKEMDKDVYDPNQPIL